MRGECQFNPTYTIGAGPAQEKNAHNMLMGISYQLSAVQKRLYTTCGELSAFVLNEDH